MACGSSVLATTRSSSLSDVCNLDMTLWPFDLVSRQKKVVQMDGRRGVIAEGCEKQNNWGGSEKENKL